MNKPVKSSDGALGFAIAGSIMSILFLIYINVTTGPEFPWSIFPSYLILWWPLGLFIAKMPSQRLFSVVGSVITVLLFAVLNYLTTPDNPWVLYVIFAVIWWPLAAFTRSTRHYKLFAWLGAGLLLAFLMIENLVETPFYLWVLYTIAPIVAWPVLVSLGKRAGNLLTSMIVSAAIIAYYVTLNFLFAPGFPWAIFPAYAVLWWPLAISTANKGRHLAFAVSATIMSTIFFIALNQLTSPTAVWWIYPIYGFLWWPLAMATAAKKRHLIFSVIATLMSAAFFITVNLVTSPGAVWWIYPVYAFLWWPLAIITAAKKRHLTFSVSATLTSAAFFITVNLVTSPGAIWWIYPVFALLWWPISIYYFVNKRKQKPADN